MATAPTAPIATVDLFLKLDGISGESADKRHPGEIVLESFSWGLSHPVNTATGASGGKTSVQDFHFAAKVTKASPQLMDRAAFGKRIKNGTLTARTVKDHFEFLFYKFDSVFITSVQEGGDGERPVDQVSFAFQKVSVEYKLQGGETTAFSWSLNPDASGLKQV